jgi:hypothetical protein
MATKTTFYLSEDLRARLKTVAAQRGTTATQLLAEGAEMVLARYQGMADREELQRRAQRAWKRLHAGLYEGPPVSDRIDELVYCAHVQPARELMVAEPRRRGRRHLP